MRIALVRQRYNPFGGAERFIERALPALERSGVEVSLIARSWPRSGPGPATGWQPRNVVLANPPYAGNLWRDWSFARAARRAWETGDFDLVQSHERIPGCELYRAGDGVHAHWLEIRRAAAAPFEHLGIALNPYHHYVCAAERSMFEHPRLRGVICNSDMVRGEIRRRFGTAPEKLHVIHNGVDLEYFHPRHAVGLRVAARAELGVATGEVLFAFVGSGFARKGLDAAIAAIAACGNASYRLVVAGYDRHAARFAALAAGAGSGGRVQLLGGRDDVRPLYAAADCFILPTRYDPFPNTVLEALAMGLPAIVGRCSGAAEIMRHGENGWICEPGDVAGLANLMHAAARVAADDIEREAARAAARGTAESYGIDDMARKLTGLYGMLRATPGEGRRQ